MDKTIKIIAVAILSLVMASCAGKQSKSQEGVVGDIVEITPSFTESVHQFEELYPFSEGMAAVRKDGKFGFINIKGELVIPCQYLYVGPFKEGLACVVKDENDMNVSFIDTAGKILKTKYSFNVQWYFGTLGNGYIVPEQLSFQNGVCEINYTDENVSETQTVYIDKQLKEIEKPKKENASTSVSDEYEIFSIPSKDVYGDEIELRGLKDKTGKIIIPAKYNNLQLSDNGVVLATLFVEDAESHLHPYKPFGLQIDGYVDFTGKSTFTEADKGKLEGYKEAQLNAMSQLKLKEAEQARLEEEQRIEEQRRLGSEINVSIHYNKGSDGFVKYSSVSSSHGHYFDQPEKYRSLLGNIDSKILVVPEGKKWIFKNIERNGCEGLILVLDSNGKYIDKKIEVRPSTHETYTFYGGQKLAVRIWGFWDDGGATFHFIEKSEYD